MGPPPLLASPPLPQMLGQQGFRHRQVQQKPLVQPPAPRLPLPLAAQALAWVLSPGQVRALVLPQLLAQVAR